MVVKNPEIARKPMVVRCSQCEGMMELIRIRSTVATYECPVDQHQFVCRWDGVTQPVAEKVAVTVGEPVEVEELPEIPDEPEPEREVQRSTRPRLRAIGAAVNVCSVCDRLYPVGEQCPSASDDRHYWKSHAESETPVDVFEDDGGSVAAMDDAPDDYGLGALMASEDWGHLMDLRREKYH